MLNAKLNVAQGFSCWTDCKSLAEQLAKQGASIVEMQLNKE